jgi:hypothetical protein
MTVSWADNPKWLEENQQINFRASADMREELNAAAQRLHCTRSEAIRTFIEWGIQTVLAENT